MTLVEACSKALGAWPSPVGDGTRARVSTHCLYPSNSAVNVYVEGGPNEFLVHDAGGAIEELAAAGGKVQYPARLLSPILKPMGLSVSEAGAIYGPRIGVEELLATIVVVGNTSREAADFLLQRHKPPRRNIGSLVERMLDREFPKRWERRAMVLGASNKRHKFDYVVKLVNDRQLLLDIVLPESSSINSAIVANLDVKNVRDKRYEQRIVYDDAAEWKASDLALVRVGARTVPFSHLSETLERFAA